MSAPDNTVPAQNASAATLIHRKAGQGRAAHQARAMTLAKSLRQTLAKVAEDSLEMAMAVIGLRRETVQGDALDPVLEGPFLRLLLDGPALSRGAALLSSDLVAALIQQQTMGCVLEQPDGAERTPTPTDAAICAPFLDEVLSRATPLPETAEDQHLLAGFRFGAWVEDARVLALALEAFEYEVIDITVDVAGGACQGALKLVLPKRALEELATGSEADRDVPVPESPAPSPDLVETVNNLKADLRIGLANLTMTLRDLSALEVGAVLPIGTPDFSRVSVQTMQGRTLSRGALGQVDGFRAIQVAHVSGRKEAPRRRASDRDDLDLPDIGDAGPSTAIAETAQALPELPDTPGDLDMPALPDLPDLPESETDAALPELDALPNLDGDAELLALDDLPDLADLPQLNALPELDDLPDLADLPDLKTG